MLSRRLLPFLIAITSAAVAQEQPAPYPPRMEGARAELYKTAPGNVPLSLYIFEPAGHQPTRDRRAAIVFFFGGGWRSGTPKQFEQHCRHLAARGMVAITADYRVATRHNTKVVDAVRDAKSAMRWVRANAARLGIDPARIAAGGGSAGGHLAAAAGLIAGLDEPGEDAKVSSRPAALVLFNPAADLVALQLAEDRTGIETRAVSPAQHVAKGAPPAIVFHGKADTTVPYRTVEAFAQAMAGAGNRCELKGFEGETHGFFNYGRGGNRAYEETVRMMDEFLESLGFLPKQNGSH